MSVQSLIAQGDSITVGNGATHNWTYYLNQAYHASALNVTNLAVSGTGFSVGGANSVINLGSTADGYLNARAALYCFAGTNDIHFGASAASVFADFSTWLGARIAAGWTYPQIWFLVPLPRASVNPTFETTRQAFIAMVVADASAKGYHLVRLDQDTDIGQAGDETNLTYYQVDQVHPTDAGQQRIASDVNTAP